MSESLQYWSKPSVVAFNSGTDGKKRLVRQLLLTQWKKLLYKQKKAATELGQYVLLSPFHESFFLNKLELL